MSDLDQHERTIVNDLIYERRRQDEKFPDQHLPNGCDASVWLDYEKLAKIAVNLHVKDGTLTWLDVLHEEVCEAFAEEDPFKLRAELVQVMGVAGRWIEDLDRQAILPENACPSCGRTVREHFTLAATEDEIANWSQSEVVCWRTRGDVQALIDEAKAQ